MFGHAAAIALFVLPLVAAVAVTLHVLVHQRDVRAAISWIGLAFLAPVSGSLLYLLFGINRVERRARRLRRRRIRAGLAATVKSASVGHLTALDATVGQITGRPITDGNAVAMLPGGDEAYPKMLAAIAGAKRSVALSSYIFRADGAGDQFIEALTQARARGVEVRVLIDGIGGGYMRSQAYHRLRQAGVAVSRFLHSTLPWRMPIINLRSHKKILVVDGARAFTGGLNIGAENLLRLHPKHPVRDTHFAVTGPVVAQLMAAFAEDWLFTTGETLHGATWFPALRNTGDTLARVITSGPDQDLEKLEYVILAALAAARQSVRIVTPYFLPDDRIATALALAALRGVAVDITIPSHNNYRVMDWAPMAQLRPLLEAGCRVWHGRPPFNHTKLMTIDGMWVLLGSANWDMRSLRLNFELDVEFYDTALAASLDAAASARPGRSITIAAIDGRPFLAVLRDALARLALPYL